WKRRPIQPHPEVFGSGPVGIRQLRLGAKRRIYLFWDAPASQPCPREVCSFPDGRSCLSRSDPPRIAPSTRRGSGHPPALQVSPESKMELHAALYPTETPLLSRTAIIFGILVMRTTSLD